MSESVLFSAVSPVIEVSYRGERVEHLDCGGLASPVGAKETENLTFSHVEGNVINGLHLPLVNFGQVGSIYDVSHFVTFPDWSTDK
jgi:hypothetical protein